MAGGIGLIFFFSFYFMLVMSNFFLQILPISYVIFKFLFVKNNHLFFFSSILFSVVKINLLNKKMFLKSITNTVKCDLIVTNIMDLGLNYIEISEHQLPERLLKTSPNWSILICVNTYERTHMVWWYHL